MTEHEAIEVLSNELNVIDSMFAYFKDFEKGNSSVIANRLKRKAAIEMAISALIEILQYHEIGTVEQVKNQKENLNVAYRIISDYEQYGSIEDFKKAQKCMQLVQQSGITKLTDDHMKGKKVE